MCIYMCLIMYKYINVCAYITNCVYIHIEIYVFIHTYANHIYRYVPILYHVHTHGSFAMKVTLIFILSEQKRVQLLCSFVTFLVCFSFFFPQQIF